MMMLTHVFSPLYIKNLKTNNKTYHICEYGVIRRREDYFDAINSLSEIYLASDEFESVSDFILKNQKPDGEADIPFLYFKKNNRVQIKVRSYVGLIETREGVVIEILPKISKLNTTNQTTEVRNIFLKMLRSLRDSPFKTLGDAHINAQKNFPLLEIFITTFINETELLFSRGLKSEYRSRENNLNYLRGKVLTAPNIRYNSFNRSKFYCEFSELTADIPQNRVIKTTLIKLRQVTRSQRNYATIFKLLTHLEEVNRCQSITDDLRCCKINNRLFKSYEKVLAWSELFLLNKGFTNFTGENTNIAILFPMEKVFENYIAHLFRKHTIAKIKTQDNKHFLIQKHIDKSKFQLRPDLYLENDKGGTMIIDTKWKLIDETKHGSNYNIQISDMYQLFAYGKKYTVGTNLPKLCIVYPKTDSFTTKLDPFIYDDQGLQLNIFPFDVTGNEAEQISAITKGF